MAIEMVEISKKEYEDMKSNIAFLRALHACGVDNWEGYGDAQAMMEEEDE